MGGVEGLVGSKQGRWERRSQELFQLYNELDPLANRLLVKNLTLEVGMEKPKTYNALRYC